MHELRLVGFSRPVIDNALLAIFEPGVVLRCMVEKTPTAGGGTAGTDKKSGGTIRMVNLL